MSIFINFFLLFITFCLPVYSSKEKSFEVLYEELDAIANHQRLKKEMWVEYLKQVDGLCDIRQEYCEYYYKIQSSLVMFEDDIYKDHGQCARARQNVENHFRTSLGQQKKQVFRIIEKLCFNTKRSKL